MLKFSENPIITTENVVPSRADFKVDGVFNAGCVKFQNEYLLLLRVAESFVNETEDEVLIPVNVDGQIVAKRLKRADANFDFSDSRIVINKTTNQTEFLTSISHLRIARSKDGYAFEIDKEPVVFPYDSLEEWGVEDPRIVEIDGYFLINYTAVSPKGACTSMVKTVDFKTFEKVGTIFTVENKDVCLFNEKINDLYYAYHRPVPKAFGTPDMWIATSPDLIHYGNHKYFLGVRQGDFWDNGRIGGGAPPIKTEHGWLSIYHACDLNNCYCLGAFLTPLNDPSTIIKRSVVPLVKPDQPYELVGFFGNVVFSCGALIEEDNVIIYYGAADDKMCRVDFTLQEIIDSMEEIDV